MRRLLPTNVTWTNRARSMLAAGLLIAVAGALLGFLDLVRLGLLLVLLPTVAWLIAVVMRPSIAVSRQVTPAPIPHGATATVVATLHNTGRHSLRPGLVEDTVTPSAEGGRRVSFYTRFLSPAVLPGQTARLTHTFTPSRRGVNVFGPATLATTDPFGLVRTMTTVDGADEVIALAPVRTLGEPPVAPAGKESSESSAVRSTGAGDLSPILREYHVGDDPRRIHWTATARHGDLLVRVDEHNRSRRAILALEQAFPFRERGNGHETGLNWAIEVLASAGVALAANDHAVHLVTTDRLHGTRPEAAVTADELLRHLSVLEPSREPDPDIATLTGDLAGQGGLLVAALPASDSAAREILSSRPGNADGFAFLIATDGTSNAHRDAERLAHEAMSGGWHALAVDPARTDVATALNELAATASRRSW